jgi:hypothetical protein
MWQIDTHCNKVKMAIFLLGSVVFDLHVFFCLFHISYLSETCFSHGHSTSTHLRSIGQLLQLEQVNRSEHEKALYKW